MPEPIDEQQGEELTAYLDGELDERAAAALERRLQGEPGLRREAAALLRTWELLDYLPQPEPSPTFASRTLDKLSLPQAPARAAAAAETPVGVAPPPRGPWPRRLALAAAALAVFLAGYGVADLVVGPTTLSRDQREHQMARDLRVIERLPLYRHADDLEFVRALDHPELFGD